ncbi:MAG: sulfotransferase domain-containing protein [Bacteroidia bacterium]
MSTAKPNFFIVGAAKSGTTSLYDYLNQHPEVYMSPIKEPNYFASDIDLDAIREEVKSRIKLLNVDEYIKSDMKKSMHRAFITSFDQYLALYRFAKNEKAIGEASASYLFSKTAARNIFEYNSNAKIIMVLRQPAQRAYSHYLMDQRMALTNLSFEDALAEEAKHPIRNWGATSLYLELGLFSEQVKRYLDVFPRDQVLILLNEELRHSTKATMKKVYSFLNVNPNFNVSLEKDFNTAAVPRNPIVRKLITVNTFRVKIRRALKNSFLKEIIKKLLFTKPEKGEMQPETKVQLEKYYKNDIKSLEKLIDIELSTWQKKI